MNDPRLGRLRAEMRAAGLDALVLSVPQNVLYASGYESILERWHLPEPLAAVIVGADTDLPVNLCLPEANIALLATLESQGKPVRADELRVFELLNFCEVARAVDPDAAPSPLSEAAMAIYGERVRGACQPDIVSAVAAGLMDMGFSGCCLGFDDLRLACHVAERSRGLDIETRDALDLTLRARIIKTAPELDAFRRIGRIADRIMQAAAERLVPGISWNELQADIADTMNRLGVTPVDEGAVLFGGSFQGEFIPELFRTRHERPLSAGQVVILETLGRAEGFWIDINRTAVIGPPTPEFQRQHDIIRDAYLGLVEHVRPGQHSGELPGIAWRYLREHGIPAPEKLLVVTHGVGHQPLEFPLPFPSQGVAGACGFELDESMVVSLDCLYFGSRHGPCHMENVFIITSDGAESTYQTPLELLGPR